MGEDQFAPLPTAAYGVVLLACGFTYNILFKAILRSEGPDSTLAKAVRDDRKGLISQLCYFAAVPLAFVHPVISGVLFVVVAVLWIVPDRRMEQALDEE